MKCVVCLKMTLDEVVAAAEYAKKGPACVYSVMKDYNSEVLNEAVVVKGGLSLCMACFVDSCYKET